MSTAATTAITADDGYASSLKAVADFWVRLRERFSRFLRELPEGYDDVDPEVFRRVPAPI